MPETVVMYSLEAYRQQVNPNAEPQIYALRLAGGTDNEALRKDLLGQANGQFNIRISDTGPNVSAKQLQGVVVMLGFVLTIIAGVNLLSVTLLGVHERTRDFGIQKALGLTPAQIAAGVVTGVCAVAVVALALGIPLGLVAYDRFLAFVADQIGAGNGF